MRFFYQCSDHLSHSKNFTSLFPLIFLSKHISLYALGRLKWILDIIWPLNQHFKLKNQRNWLKQVWMWKLITCILLHWRKKLTLVSVQWQWNSSIIRNKGQIGSFELATQSLLPFPDLDHTLTMLAHKDIRSLNLSKMLT